MKLRALVPRTQARAVGLEVGGALRVLVAGWIPFRSGRPRVTIQVDSPYTTPLVRRTAAELGVDLTSVTGTGVGGRIRPVDVRAASCICSTLELDRARTTALISLAYQDRADELDLLLALLPADGLEGVLRTLSPAEEVAARVRAICAQNGQEVTRGRS
jgi:hypothetical protein